MTAETVLGILAFAVGVGALIAALLTTDRRRVHIVAIVVSLTTLLLVGAVFVKEWHSRREAIKDAELEIMAVVQTASMTEEDIFEAVNAHQPPGHARAENLLFDALYCLVDKGALRVNTQGWQDMNANTHHTHLYHR
jgi:hypothetical protein